MIVEDYLPSQETRKPHIGCSDNILDGWLNSDESPDNGNILRLDATLPFPIEDQEFDFFFIEHMIEHNNYALCSFMLSECYSILRNNGKIRIYTPNLSFLIDLYKENLV